MSELPTWQDQLRRLDPVVDRLLAIWRPEGASEAEVQDMTKLAMSILACGYLCHVYTDARRPVFMPLWNFACNQGGPNPDYIYLNAQVDDRRRLRDQRIPGQLPVRRDHPAATGHDRNGHLYPPPRRPGAPEGADHARPRRADHRRRRELQRHPQRASGPTTTTATGGSSTPEPNGFCCASAPADWNNEIDARIAINRLDDTGDDMTPAEIARRIADLPEWIEGMIHFDMHLVRYYLEHHGKNVLLRSQWIQQGGGLATKQAYYDGIYEIDDDEALIVEFPVPSQCHYWQILVADDRFATVDWVNRQSSLNDVQAHIDPDGWFRAVVSKQDPDVYNWLDKADWPWGILQARFYRADQFPDATVTKVSVNQVLDHLPADTRRVTREERIAQLRHRRRGAQLRHIW